MLTYRDICTILAWIEGGSELATGHAVGLPQLRLFLSTPLGELLRSRRIAREVRCSGEPEVLVSQRRVLEDLVQSPSVRWMLHAETDA